MSHPSAILALTRRRFLRNLGIASFAGFVKAQSGAAPVTGTETIKMPFANGQRSLATFPQKRPLILLTMRPPQLETPFSIFNQGLLTPNDAFFVRYHFAQVPTSIDPEEFTLDVKGSVNSVSKFSMDELKKSNQLELVS